MKILLIEDEAPLGTSIQAYLQGESYICEWVKNFSQAIEKTELYDYDCILLDISLPGGSGLDILKNLKANKKTDCVLIISARNSVDEKVAGLKLGADDYLPKPFHLSELSARVAALIRRTKFHGISTLSFHDITINTDERSVEIGGKTLDLTKKEYELLLYFFSNKNKVLSKEAIAMHLWGDDMQGDNSFIYTHIKNIRRKMQVVTDVEYIHSVYGIGYKLSAP